MYRLFFAHQLLIALAFARAVEAGEVMVQSFSEPAQTVDVAAPEQGIVEELKVSLGQSVKRGDPLLILDRDTLYSAQEVAAAKADCSAEVEAAKIQLKMKQDRVHKLKTLERHGSEEELIKARVEVELANTQVVAAEEKNRIDRLELRRIEQQIARRTVRSPIDGVVIKLHRQPGEFTAANEPQLVTIVRLDQLRLKLHIPTAKATSLTAKSELMIRFLETGDEAHGRVDFFSPVTAADSGTVKVEILIPNPQGRLRSGTRCTWIETPQVSERPALRFGRLEVSETR